LPGPSKQIQLLPLKTQLSQLKSFSNKNAPQTCEMVKDEGNENDSLQKNFIRKNV
jgi:hypothetical protein